MKLHLEYAEYLRQGAHPEHAAAFARVIEGVAPSIAEALAAYAAGGPGTFDALIGEHTGKQIYVGPTLPVAEPGALWFDTADLSTMMLLHSYVDPADRDDMSPELEARTAEETTWFAVRPVGQFQFAAFVEVVGRKPPSSFAVRDALAPVTSITFDDAYAYLEYFGKGLPNSSHWHAAEELGLAAWSVPAREWTRSAHPDAYGVVLTPVTLDVDPEDTIDETDDEKRMQYALDEVPANVTFRSRVSSRVGLRTRPSAFGRASARP